jgi:hypothetical protein
MRFDRDPLSWLRAHRPNLVIVGSRSDVWIGDSSHALAEPGGKLTNSPREKKQLWAGGLRAEISQLTGVGVPVLIVHPVPVIRIGGGGCAAILTLLDRGCRGAVARSRVDSELRPTLSAERSAVKGLHARVLDLEPELCTAATCSSTQRGIPMYLDQYHLSVVGSIRLAPAFYRAIRATART